jgi:hypothetical protein
MEVEESIRKNTSTPAQLKFPDECILPREGDRNDGRDTSSGRQREDTQFLLRQSLFSSHFLKGGHGAQRNPPQSTSVSAIDGGFRSCFWLAQEAVVGAFVGAFVGALIGAFVGAVAPKVTGIAAPASLKALLSTLWKADWSSLMASITLRADVASAAEMPMIIYPMIRPLRPESRRI